MEVGNYTWQVRPFNTSVGLMLNHRHRRWTNNNPILDANLGELSLTQSFGPGFSFHVKSLF